MKRKTKTTLIAVALGLAASLLSGCHRSKATEVLASSPFAMDKAGASVQVEFNVKPEHLATRRRLMVALDFPRTSDRKLEEAIRRGRISAHVQVSYIQDGQPIPVVTQDNDALRNPSSKGGGNVAHLNLYAFDANTSFVLIAGFLPTSTGHYTATVTTMQDEPLFAGVATSIKIKPFYNTGE